MFLEYLILAIVLPFVIGSSIILIRIIFDKEYRNKLSEMQPKSYYKGRCKHTPIADTPYKRIQKTGSPRYYQ